jgi:hypothetical protein
MKVDLDVLRAALNQSLDHVEEAKGKAVEVPDDLYWFVPKEALHDPAREPTNLTLGSLNDDWAEVSAIGRGEKEPFGHALVWASTVIRALGERTF